MKKTLIPILAAAGIALSPAAAFAQNGQNGQYQNNQPMQSGQAGQGSQNQIVTQQKLKQSLQNAGFTNVQVVDAAYLVKAKTQDGDTVVMMINPPSEITGAITTSPQNNSSEQNGLSGQSGSNSNSSHGMGGSQSK